MARSGDATNLWMLPFDSARLTVTGRARPITSGTDSVLFAKVRGTSVVFNAGEYSSNVWTLPVRAEQARVSGPLRQMTARTGLVMRPEMSPDGHLVAYSYSLHTAFRHFLSEMTIVVRDLDSGQDRVIAREDLGAWAPHFFDDGRHVVFGMLSEKSDAAYVTSVTGSDLHKISDDCPGPSGSPSGRWLLCRPRGDERVTGLEISSGQQREILSDGKSTMWETRLSRDEHWVTWVRNDRASGVSQIFVAPFRGLSKIPTWREWIPLTEAEYRSGHGSWGRPWAGHPAWSPGGNVIYYLSDRDGFRCLWAQRLQVKTKQPEGGPIAIHHFHGLQRLDVVSEAVQNLSIGPDKLAFLLLESKTTIWMADLDQSVAHR